jgi:hypothetical protein
MKKKTKGSLLRPEITPVKPIAGHKFPPYLEGIWNFLRYIKICVYLFHDFSQSPYRFSAEA